MKLKRSDIMLVVEVWADKTVEGGGRPQVLR